MGSCQSCFDGGKNKELKKEQDRLASEEARAKAAEAAHKRQELFDQSAAGRAARAQQVAMAKQAANTNQVADGMKVLYLPNSDPCYYDQDPFLHLARRSLCISRGSADVEVFVHQCTAKLAF